MQDEPAIAGAPDLPPLSREHAALVAKHPMRQGQPDAIVNKKLLASALDVSTTTIDAWDLEGLPCETKGTNGRSYEYRLSVAWAWTREREANEAAAKAYNESAAAQMRMDLVGGDSRDQSRAALPLREQADVMRLEKEWMLAAANRRELVWANAMAEAVEDMLVRIRDALAVAPDLIVRDLGLEPADAENIQDVLDKCTRDASTAVHEAIAGVEKA